MKLVSWNVNGLRACVGKGFSDVFRRLDADCFCLQETKLQGGQLDLVFRVGVLIGILLRRRATPARPSSRATSLWT